MTLDTRIIIKNPDVSPEAVLAFINRELLRVENPEPAPWPSPHVSPEWTERNYPGVRKLGNRVGQGLFAIAEITVREPLAPISSDYMAGLLYDGSPDPEEDAEYLDERGPNRPDPALVTGSMEVSFDTAYGFQVGGAGCGDLHAYFILRLAEEYGPVAWLAETSGDWFAFAGPDDLGPVTEHLGDPWRGQDAVGKREAVA